MQVNPKYNMKKKIHFLNKKNMKEIQQKQWVKKKPGHTNKKINDNIKKKGAKLIINERIKIYH